MKLLLAVVFSIIATAMDAAEIAPEARRSGYDFAVANYLNEKLGVRIPGAAGHPGTESSQNSLLEERVCCELVSVFSKFPASWEKTGNFGRF